LKIGVSFLIFAVFSVMGFSSCQNQEDMDHKTENLEPILLLDTVFQFGIAHFLKLDNASDTDNWDWENSTYINTFVDNILGETVPWNMTVPWKTMGNALSILNPNIDKSYGWELKFSNFGTLDFPVKRPYFLIYNRTMGKIYFFVHNTQSQAGNYAVAELEIQSEKQDFKLVLVSKQAKFSQFDSWFNFEFDIDSKNSDIILKSEIWQLVGTGVQITRLSGSGRN
jgi:hypothetical protein